MPAYSIVVLLSSWLSLIMLSFYLLVFLDDLWLLFFVVLDMSSLQFCWLTLILCCCMILIQYVHIWLMYGHSRLFPNSLENEFVPELWFWIFYLITFCRGTPAATLNIYKDSSVDYALDQQQHISMKDLHSWLSLGGRAERNKENNVIPTKWTSYKVWGTVASAFSSLI